MADTWEEVNAFSFANEELRRLPAVLFMRNGHQGFGD